MEGAAVGEDALEVEDARLRRLADAEQRRMERERRQPGPTPCADPRRQRRELVLGLEPLLRKAPAPRVELVGGKRVRRCVERTGRGVERELPVVGDGVELDLAVHSRRQVQVAHGCSVSLGTKNVLMEEGCLSVDVAATVFPRIRAAGSPREGADATPIAAAPPAGASRPESLPPDVVAN